MIVGRVAKTLKTKIRRQADSINKFAGELRRAGLGTAQEGLDTQRAGHRVLAGSHARTCARQEAHSDWYCRSAQHFQEDGAQDHRDRRLRR
eukprot:4655073-Pyramimonas_sp.AAC.1